MIVCAGIVLLIAASCGRAQAVGEKAMLACRTHGRAMLECLNILHPASRRRVPIDLLLYPHMVLIGFRKRDAGAEWKCGGTLISDRWVVTAAHCREDPTAGSPALMRVGTATFEFDEVDELAQERAIAAVVVHPGFAPPSKYHDIALMRADPPFVLSRDIRIACLHVGGDIPAAKLTAIGFGTTRSGAQAGSQTLMKVDVDLVDGTACNASMRALVRRRVLSRGITDEQLCAGDYEHGGRDTCQGDSGGPLQYMEERVDCEKTFPLHVLVGVTSFGRDCGRRMAPGVYTRVAKYVGWIESVVWPDPFVAGIQRSEAS